MIEKAGVLVLALLCFSFKYIPFTIYYLVFNIYCFCVPEVKMTITDQETVALNILASFKFFM